MREREAGKIPDRRKRKLGRGRGGIGGCVWDEEEQVVVVLGETLLTKVEQYFPSSDAGEAIFTLSSVLRVHTLRLILQVYLSTPQCR